MTTGATGQLGLALPVQGELTGSWGNTVNNGITEYTNIAIAATLTLTNDGAVTLANTTGDASASNIVSTLTGAGTVTAQFAIVRVTGTLTVAKVVTAPSYSKTYTVVNAATGGIVTFKAAGQTGVSVAVGESAFVYFNGTDYVKVSGTSAVTSFQTSLSGLTPSTSTTGAVTLAGTLDVANGGTGQTTFTAGRVLYGNGTGGLNTSANLVFNGTSLNLDSAGSFTSGSSGFGLVLSKNGVGPKNAIISVADASSVLLINNSTAGWDSVATYAAGSENMRLNAQALGVGIVPQTGWSGFKALQIGANISLWSATSGGGTSYYSNNLYYNGSNRIYITSGFASEYQQTNGGGHSWYSAPTGTAGNAISLVNTMNLDEVGNLKVGGSAARGTTVGTKHLDLFNGTAPAGTLTDGVSLYSSSGDLKFMNAAGDAFDVGYRNIPQNVQTGSYTLTLADAGDHIYRGSGSAATWTIPAASSVAYPIGTAITFINLSATAVSIAITTDTMYLSSAGTTGTRTLAQYGSATAIKVSGVSSSGIWVISGSGLT